MVTTNFYSETPVLEGKDAKRLLKAMENVQPLKKEVVDEIYSCYQNFLSRRVKKDA